MEDVNNLLEEAVKSGLVSNIETLKKIVGKLSSVKPTDAYNLKERDVNNWLSFFLPLVFNNDSNIQAEVIRGLELFIPKLHKSSYQTFTVWPTIRKDIIETYTKHVREMFDNNKPEWHKVCIILLSILDQVIATSTVAINMFLPIIELAFRSDNYQSRAVAFLCWNEMIKIFIKFNQISDPKRIKLICIPLKSSRSKTKEIAENKFQVWWTLLQALGPNLVEHTHLIESFIYFCVGPLGKQNEPLGSYLSDKNLHLASPGKIFDSIRDYSIVALAYMLGKPNRAVQRLAKQLPVTYQDNSKICDEAIFAKIGNTFIAAAIETTVLISKLDTNQLEINDCIWNALLSYITDKNAIKYRRFILENLSMFKRLATRMSAEYLEILNQLIASVIVACVCHPPFINDASTNEMNEMVNIVNLFIDNFKTKQITSLPASIKARVKFEPKKATSQADKSPKTSTKKDKEEFVAIPNIWKFNPETLTEHQKEKMKERREDIPSLYDGNSQSSQDTEVKPWNPKQIVIAGEESSDTMLVLNDNSNSVTPVITKVSKKDSNEDVSTKKPTGPSPRKALTRSSSVSPRIEFVSPKKTKSDESPLKCDPLKIEMPPRQPETKTSPQPPQENAPKGAARRKAGPKSKRKELQNLAIDTIEGKKLMEELQNQPSEKATTRRTSIDRGAKRVEPAWKQSLVPVKKTRKSKMTVEVKNSNETKSTTPAKKILTQKNDNKVSEIIPISMLKEISEEPETHINTKKDTEEDSEAIPNSQDPLKEQLDRRRSRRESLINKSTQEKSPEEKTEAEKKADATRNIDFDEVPGRTLRNSPVISVFKAAVKTEKTPERVQTPKVNEMTTPIKTPEKLVTTPNTLRSSPRKPGSSTDALHAAVPHPIIATNAKSTSPTEASTANGADLETLNELRRSPRKSVGEIIELNEKPAVAQMSPLKIAVQDCNQASGGKETIGSPDLRRKSPRKNSISPVQIQDHGYAVQKASKVEKMIVDNEQDEEEEVDYQIEEEGTSSDDNANEDAAEGSQVFMGEIVAPTSPTPDLDEKLEPIDRSMTIPSSPDVSFNDEKTSEFLNNTVDISPIATGKSSPITRLAAKNATSNDSPTATSPTDRMVTRLGIQGIVNLDSPKTSNVMQGGRGAHMMSMVFKQNSSTPNQAPTTSSRSFSMGPPKNLQEARDILVFSKTLPGPDASPSASILKRKLDDTVEEVESPANKRKRVSFHDPPVSVTKEYIRHEEEIRSPSLRPPINRCLQMAAVAQQKFNPNNLKRFNTSLQNATSSSGSPTSQFRYTLKRKSKRESSNDLRKLDLPSTPTFSSSLPLPQIPNNRDDDMDTLMLNTHDHQSTQNQSQDSNIEKDTSIRFGSKNEVLQYVLNTYELEEILETYLEEKKTLNPKAVRIMARELSNQMETDSKLRYSTLDRLSEKHAAEFLEHAIQENPSKAICERLTLPVLLNYIMEKASSDAESKLQILKKFETFIAGDQQTPSLLTKEELMTFILNCMPEMISQAEMALIMDEIFDDKTPAEIYDTFTTYFKKFLVNV